LFRFSEIIEDLISTKLTIIFWGFFLEYFIGLLTYDHDRFTLIFRLHGTDITCTTLHLLDITCTTLHVSDITCTTIYLSLDIATVYIVPWSLYTLFSLCDTDIYALFPDHIHWVTHYFALTLINKINQVGVTGGEYSRKNSGKCVWKGDPLWVWIPHLILLFMRAPVITCYMIPEYSELFLPAIRIH